MDKQIIERAVEAAAKADYEALHSNPGRRKPWDERPNDLCDGLRSYVRPLVTAALAEVESSLTAERDDLAARIARVEALHTPVEVWEYDSVEGVFVLGQDDELLLLTTLCSECTDPDVLGQIEDCEYQEGTGHEVEHPCPTIKAIRGESE